MDGKMMAMKRGRRALQRLFRPRSTNTLSILLVWMLAGVVLGGCATGKTAPRLLGGHEDLKALDVSIREDLKLVGDDRPLPDKAGLEDYLVYAALHNPGLQAAFNAWKAALWKIPQVRTLPDPRFTYAYFVQEVETRVGPQHQKFALAQTFPWLSKLELRGDVAAKEAKAKRAFYEAEKWKLFQRVEKAYFEYAYLRQALAVTEENIRLLKHLERSFQTRYAASVSPYSSLIRLQTELGRLEDRLKSLTDMRRPLVAELNAALNRPEGAPLSWPSPVRLVSVAISDEQLRTWLREGNPELRALSELQAKEKKAIALARQNYFPDFTLAVETVDTGDALNSDTPDSGKNPVAVGLSINLPIWWNKYQAGVKEASNRWRAAGANRREKENRLLSRLSLALFKYRDAERKVDLYKNGLIPKAQHSLQVSLQDLETGQGTYLDVIDTQRMLLEFELAYERAEADKAQQLAVLERLCGRFLIDRVSGQQAVIRSGQKNP